MKVGAGGATGITGIADESNGVTDLDRALLFGRGQGLFDGLKLQFGLLQLLLINYLIVFGLLEEIIPLGPDFGQILFLGLEAFSGFFEEDFLIGIVGLDNLSVVEKLTIIVLKDLEIFEAV